MSPQCAPLSKPYPIVGQNRSAFRDQWLRDMIYFSFVGCGSGFAYSKGMSLASRATNDSGTIASFSHHLTALAQELSLSFFFFFLKLVKIRLRKTAGVAGEEPKQEPFISENPEKEGKTKTNRCLIFRPKIAVLFFPIRLFSSLITIIFFYQLIYCYYMKLLYDLWFYGFR